MQDTTIVVLVDNIFHLSPLAQSLPSRFRCLLSANNNSDGFQNGILSVLHRSNGRIRRIILGVTSRIELLYVKVLVLCIVSMSAEDEVTMVVKLWWLEWRPTEGEAVERSQTTHGGLKDPEMLPTRFLETVRHQATAWLRLVVREERHGPRKCEQIQPALIVFGTFTVD